MCYIYDYKCFLNQEHQLNEKEYPFPDLLTSLFIFAGKRRIGGKNLIFIDEIHNSPKAVDLLS
jgi:hypothetical protein